MDKTYSIQYLLLHAKGSQRGFLITLDSSYLQALLAGQQIIYRKIDTLKPLTDLLATKMENEELQYLTEKTEGKKNAKKGTFI